jgi:hypothetical protein
MRIERNGSPELLHGRRNEAGEGLLQPVPHQGHAGQRNEENQPPRDRLPLLVFPLLGPEFCTECSVNGAQHAQSDPALTDTQRTQAPHLQGHLGPVFDDDPAVSAFFVCDLDSSGKEGQNFGSKLGGRDDFRIFPG